MVVSTKPTHANSAEMTALRIVTLPICPTSPASTQAIARSARNASANGRDRKSTRLNSSHANISYAVFCLKKKKRRRVARHGRIAGGAFFDRRQRLSGDEIVDDSERLLCGQVDSDDGVSGDRDAVSHGRRQ